MEQAFVSSMLAGEDVVRVALASLSLGDLLAHREHAFEARARLVEENGRTGLSGPTRMAVLNLLRKLHAHMAHLFELIEDRQVEAAWAAAEAARLGAERQRGRSPLR